MYDSIIYIPTMTSKLRFLDDVEENILYSPNKNLDKVIKGRKITIWDNYTYYLRFKYNKKDKHEVARNHYLWLISFISSTYQEGITLITPDVEWLEYRNEIEEQWYKSCRQYPQLYVPNTWENYKGLNIVGHALRLNTPNEFAHPSWNHCLRHVRKDLKSPVQTYDAIHPIA